jgi:hypothetical protein
VFLVWVRRGERDRLMVMRSTDGGHNFEPPHRIWSSRRELIDTEALLLENGDVLVFAVEVKGEPNSNRARCSALAFRSRDGGASWTRLRRPVRTRYGVNLEDLRAVETETGDVLLAWEHELVEGGGSRIPQLRSTDGGTSWQEPTALWDDREGADYEPGGYVQVTAGELWFVASTDEEAIGGSYAEAVIKVKVSRDGGRTWVDKKTLVAEPDQVSFGGVMLDDSEVGLLSVRGNHATGTPGYYLYIVDPSQPGRWWCAARRPP